MNLIQALLIYKYTTVSTDLDRRINFKWANFRNSRAYILFRKTVWISS